MNSSDGAHQLRAAKCFRNLPRENENLRKLGAMSHVLETLTGLLDSQEEGV